MGGFHPGHKRNVGNRYQAFYFERKCDYCGDTYRAARRSSKFCSAKCRMANHRGRRGRQLPIPPDAFEYVGPPQAQEGRIA